MKRVGLILVVVFALVFASTASAGTRETVGDRIGIFYSGEQTFPAGQPFYIQHGYVDTPPAPRLGLSTFALEVDGVVVRPDYMLREVDTGADPVTISSWWVYNFPDGMTGTHTFTGRWYSACGDAEGCANPAELVETRTSTVVITFE